MNQSTPRVPSPPRFTRRGWLTGGLVAGLALTTTSLFAACQSASQTAAPTSSSAVSATTPAASQPAPTQVPATTAPTTVTFVTSETVDSATAKALTDIFRAYQQAHPSQKVQLQPIPYDNFMQTLTTRVVGNQAPDAALLLDRFATAMVAQKALLPLDGKLPSGYGEAFNKPAWNFAVVDAHPYAIPLYTNVQAIIYNQNQFEKAGVTPPKDPKNAWTFAQVVDAAKTVKAANGIPYGMIHWPASVPARLSQYLVAEGGSIFTEDFSGPALETPVAIKLLTEIQDTFRIGLCPKDNWSVSAVQPDPMFGLWANAKAPMLLSSGNFQIPNAVKFVGDTFKWSFAFQPTTLGTPIELVTFKQTKQADETVALLQFLAEPSNMALMSTRANLVPTRTDIPSSLLTYAQGAEQMGLLTQQLTLASTRIQREMALPAWSEIDLMLRKQMEELALQQKTPEQMAKDSSAEIVRILDRYKKS